MGKVKRFGPWFESQFGKRPGAGRTHDELVQAVSDARWVLSQAEAVLREREKYEANERAALYAWQARGAADPVQESPLSTPHVHASKPDGGR